MTDTVALNAEIDRRGFRKAWLAEKLGISRQALNRKLKGEIEFSPEQIAILAGVMGFNNDEIVAIFLTIR